MNTKVNVQLHLLMAALLLGSVVLDQREVEFWKTGQIGIITLALALVWLGRYAMEGFQNRDAMIKVLHNRLKAVEERCDELERESRSRRAPILGGSKSTDS